MRLTVEFPSVIHRDGPTEIARLASAIEEIGYDEIDIFDHVINGYQIEGRDPAPYPATMPLLEALVTLGYIAAVTERVGLGTEVLVLPQRQPVLAAKQFSTIDTLSGGRLRVGVGVGWQESEYDALGMDFRTRGRAMDEAIALMQACWRDETIEFGGEHFQAESMAMEPKPPQGGGIPLWIGGGSKAALRRAGRVGDGWMASGMLGSQGAEAIAEVKREAEEAGRDPDALGFQCQLATPPRAGDPSTREYWARIPDVAATAAAAQEAGFGWAAVNVTGVFVAGARSIDAMIEQLGLLHDAIRAETGRDE
ncbi:MAG: LLM class F420-dependent oxidoreductase [Chloroflexi bacterium]|nr:LLM class F420-dependent oxidoreductase [Chloroflexota bacterium]MCY3588972.1 LLM class F420-dependent oxidoreductase [Chloroflexota bacterium]MCY3687190.1 LLM class F420-dependent oxidoreductase [Chloroflexota bacterium]MDE2707370.1 LLM class F420-dependent oxidoreductase [Chloroflexota bacterium]